MSHSLRIYPDARLIIVVYKGDLTLEELQKARNELLHHPDYNATFDGVSDFRQSVKKYRPDQLFPFSEKIVKENRSKGRWCSLNSTPVETSLAELLKNKLSRTHPFEVFSTLEAASEYLDIDLKEYLESD